MTKAGFAIRAVALIVDAIIVGIGGSIVTNVLFGGETTRGGGLATVIGIAYYVYFWTESGGGQTLGMRLFNLKVVRTDGSFVTPGQALIRYVMLIVSFVVFFLGVLWVIFDPDKQGWHDKVAGTYVIRV